MDSCGINRMYQSLVVRNENVKANTSDGGYTFYVNNTNIGLMMNDNTKEAVVFGLSPHGVPLLPAYYCKIVDNSCVSTNDLVSDSDKERLISFLRNSNIVA